jgi:hypothetical protein
MVLRMAEIESKMAQEDGEALKFLWKGVLHEIR